MLFECSQMCFRFAHELIDIYSRHLDPEEVTGPVPNWWYSVLCALLNWSLSHQVNQTVR